MPQSRIGLDLGSTAVRAAEVRLGGDSATVVRAAQVPLEPGVVENGEVREPEAATEAIKELWRRGGFRSRQMVMGLANQRVVVREVTVPELPPKEMRESLPFQVGELIPIPVEDAVLDYDVLEELEQEGRRMVRLLVVAAQREMVDRQVQAATGARLDPILVDLVPFALIRAIGHQDGLGLEESDAGGEAVIDVGADVTNICVHEHGRPRFVRILPSGGRDVTATVASALGIGEEQAEALKRGRTAVTGEAREVLEGRSAALVNEIRSSLDFYLTQTPDARVTRLLVTGGGSKLPGFLELLGRKVGAPTDRGHPFEKVVPKLTLEEADLAEAEPLLAVAIGLALPQEA